MKRAPRVVFLALLGVGSLAGSLHGEHSMDDHGASSPVSVPHGAQGNGGSESSPSADTLRALQPEDLFRLHRIGSVRISPDGQRMAYEIVRPGGEGATQRLTQHLAPRADLWIAGTDAEPRPLTEGAPDGTGWFQPRWSPDGERLAFLSVEGNEVRAWLWEPGEEEPRPLTEHAVHLTNVGPLLFRWISERELAVAVRPEGAPGHGRVLADETRPGLFAVRARQASWSGREATVDVLETGPGADGGEYVPRTEFRVIEVEEGARTAASGRWGLALPSPGGRWVATLSDPPVGAIDPEEPVEQRPTFSTRPGAVPLEEGDEVAFAKGSSADALDDPQPHTIRWAPDDSAFALLTRSTDGEGEGVRTRVAVYRPDEHRLRLVGDSAMEVESFAWTGSGELLVRARRTQGDAGEGATHWWRPQAQGEWRKWTAGMEAIPSELVPVPGGAVGVSDGTLWRLSDGGHERIAMEEDGELQRLVGPAPPFSVAQAPPQARAPDGPVRVLASASEGMEVWSVRLESAAAREVHRIPVPEGGGPPVDVAPRGQAAAFSSSDETGTWLWRSRAENADAGSEGARGEGAPGGDPAIDTLVATDLWLQGVKGAETRQLTYRGPEGDELTAWMLLPPEETGEDPLPTVVWVYPGVVRGGGVPFEAQLNTTGAIGALQLLASRGYAVLLPSMPLGPEPFEGRPELAETVLPAVDRAVDEELADPSRLGLMGHSYGGFGVSHLVSQTDRFQAAVASAAATHLRSFYGTFDARGRYGHMRHPLTLQLSTQGYFETGQGRMGAPPALAPERYRKASPLTYVDQVSTPLMFIHGDQDFVPIQQAEMFFNELVRLGKRAQFVRYAGEGHVINGRANVLDMWERVGSWFDEFLGAPESPAGGR